VIPSRRRLCPSLTRAREKSRLVTRLRIKYYWNSPAALFNLLIEFGDWFMMRKCLLGIKN
jgi:hypothetical protein